MFLFPHQDDEFGVLHVLDTNHKSGRRSICIYLTDGSGGGKDPHKRDLESLNVLSKLGVKSQDIFFLGNKDRVRDGRLVDALELSFNRLSKLLANQEIDVLYTPTWEGGHPDHDAAALLAYAFMLKRRGLKVLGFPLYNAFNIKLAPFGLFRPIEANGDLHSLRIPNSSVLRHLSYCLMYPTQVKTWIALFPATVWHYAFDRNQYLQDINQQALRQKPHSGDLLYERRNWLSWENFSSRSQEFCGKHLS